MFPVNKNDVTTDISVTSSSPVCINDLLLGIISAASQAREGS